MSINQLDVLVADDHKLTRDMIGQVLSALDCRKVRFVADGADAFTEIIAAPPDLAIVDYHMPLDGLALLEKVRRAANSPDQSLPVIVMTSMTDLKRVMAFRDAGATEIVAKPFTAASMLSRVAAVIDSRRPFVRGGGFVGPCRRRRADPEYAGPLRRATDGGASRDADSSASRDVVDL
ncbi:MAG TPA: response regulator [Caulobacteraceae bacterium]|jgi:DNA-binding response OmpR family regulator